MALVEDDENLRTCLTDELNRSPGLTCVGAYELAEPAIDAIPKVRPDVVLMDLMLPRMPGVEATSKIKQRWPRVRVLAFTGHGNIELIVTAFSAGADGYILKSTPRQKLAEIIKRVHEGGSPISRQVAGELVSWLHRHGSLLLRLSPTEKRILALLERGESYKRAAAELGMSVNTLKTHVHSILLKTDAFSIAQAAHIRKQVF